MIVPIRGRNKRSSFGFLWDIYNNISVECVKYAKNITETDLNLSQTQSQWENETFFK